MNLEPSSRRATAPKRVILFMIDGLHVKSPDCVEMPALRRLIPQGTYAPNSWMIMPHHPTVGEYGRLHTTSFPNPVLMSGNVFLRADSCFIQEVSSAIGKTAFLVNSNSYRSVSRGFDELIQAPDATDAQVVEMAMSALRHEDFVFMRLHLQTAGNLGRTACMYGNSDNPFYRNIWGIGSPYKSAIANADTLLGQFTDFLKAQGKWDDTVFIVSSDHGQSEQGWHPIADPDSWRTPLLFIGPGIAKGRCLAYAEHTDIVPTICLLLGIKPPNPGPGAGSPINAILAERPDDSAVNLRFIEQVSHQNLEYLYCRALLQLASAKNPYYSSQITLLENELITPEPFYSVERFLEWHRAGSTEHLLETNNKILAQIRVDAAVAAKTLEMKPEQISFLALIQ
ncbi:MAG TPA: sulfatase-like hydrolase/transferase [Verrucomicrobiae bacterium]|nr:sulfatase-like hydrolase/transferase [Verrucomicrobiae bacterium]